MIVIDLSIFGTKIYLYLSVLYPYIEPVWGHLCFIWMLVFLSGLGPTRVKTYSPPNCVLYIVKDHTGVYLFENYHYHDVFLFSLLTIWIIINVKWISWVINSGNHTPIFISIFLYIYKNSLPVSFHLPWFPHLAGETAIFGLDILKMLVLAMWVSSFFAHNVIIPLCPILYYCGVIYYKDQSIPYLFIHNIWRYTMKVGYQLYLYCDNIIIYLI